MKCFYLSLMTMLASLICIAKERSVEVAFNINENEKTSFLGNPWVWVGTVIFVFLFLAVTRGSELKSPKP